MALYRGIQQSKEGLRVILADQDKALENVARHLGMFKDVSHLDVTTDSKSLQSGVPISPEELHAAIQYAINAV